LLALPVLGSTGGSSGGRVVGLGLTHAAEVEGDEVEHQPGLEKQKKKKLNLWRTLYSANRQT
jgi:hypothetical protein